MQHRPFALHHHRRTAAEWDAPFAPIVVRPVGGSGRRHTEPVRPVAPLPAPIVRLAAIYRAIGLRNDPFALAPATHGTAHLAETIADQAEALASWMIAPEHRGSLAVITGEAGSGRTTVLAAARQILATAPGSGSWTLLQPDLGSIDASMTDGRLLRAIVAAFGTDPAGRTGLDLIRQVRDLAAASPSPVVLLDGADLSGSRLDILRSLLAGDPASGETALRIVITGSPDLRARLRRRTSLVARMTLDLRIAPLDATALASFLAQRIAFHALHDDERTDMAPPAIAFTPDATAIVLDWSGGIIGRVIELAGECLLEAIARGARAVDEGIAHDVAREFTDRARNAARHQADDPFVVAAVQARIALPFATEGDAETQAPASSQATTPGAVPGEHEA